MATLQVKGTARVSFDTTVEVEIDDEVSEHIGDELGGDLSLEDVEIDSVSIDSLF